MDTTTMPDTFFRTLTAEEEETFRVHIRQTYTAGEWVNPLWHPVSRDECAIINATAEAEAEDAMTASVDRQGELIDEIEAGIRNAIVHLQVLVSRGTLDDDSAIDAYAALAALRYIGAQEEGV